MKKFTTIILLLVGFNTSIAQKKVTITEYANDENLKKSDLIIINPYAEKFLGKWIWQEGNQRIEVEIKKKSMKEESFGKMLQMDVFGGSYKYFIDGKAVLLPETNFMYHGQIFSEKEPLVFTTRLKRPNFMFHTNYVIEVHYVDSNTIILKYQKNVPDDHKKIIPIPLDITLKKI